MTHPTDDLVSQLREACNSGKGNYGHRLLCGQAADEIEGLLKRLDFSATALGVVERRRDELLARQCDCGPAECKRVLSDGSFVPPPGWVYQPDLRDDADRYRFLRLSETEMGPKAEEAYAQVWSAITKKGCEGKRMDSAIDAGRNSYYAASAQDEEDGNE